MGGKKVLFLTFYFLNFLKVIVSSRYSINRSGGQSSLITFVLIKTACVYQHRQSNVSYSAEFSTVCLQLLALHRELLWFSPLKAGLVRLFSFFKKIFF